jgi:hypothetical protein
VGHGNGDPRRGGSTAGVLQQAARAGERQAVEATEDRDLGAAAEPEMPRQAARSTPPMADVRSDADAGAGSGNGEPL